MTNQIPTEIATLSRQSQVKIIDALALYQRLNEYVLDGNTKRVSQTNPEYMKRLDTLSNEETSIMNNWSCTWKTIDWVRMLMEI